MPKTILIAAFEGWNDASQAATNVVRHLVSRYESQEVRHIDNEGFYDYQVARPMICSVQGRKRIILAANDFYDIARLPHAAPACARSHPNPITGGRNTAGRRYVSQKTMT